MMMDDGDDGDTCTHSYKIALPGFLVGSVLIATCAVQHKSMRQYLENTHQLYTQIHTHMQLAQMSLASPVCWHQHYRTQNLDLAGEKRPEREYRSCSR